MSPAVTAGTVLLTLGLLFGLATAHRHFAGCAGRERMTGGAVLLTGFAFAGIVLMARTGRAGFGWPGTVFFALFLLGLCEIARQAPGRRLAAAGAVVLLLAGTLTLRTLRAAGG